MESLIELPRSANAFQVLSSLTSLRMFPLWNHVLWCWDQFCILLPGWMLFSTSFFSACSMTVSFKMILYIRDVFYCNKVYHVTTQGKIIFLNLISLRISHSYPKACNSSLLQTSLSFYVRWGMLQKWFIWLFVLQGLFYYCVLDYFGFYCEL